jgi:hypothetical protein
MIVAYTFVGPLPSYCIETVHQLRLFFNGDVYFIVNDLKSEYLDTLKQKYNVNVIDYNLVVHNDFNALVTRKFNKFELVPGLKGREKLFIHAFERFYLLLNLMNRYSLKDIMFLELDNLLYNDPREWLELFSKKDMAYMFDHYNRASSGIAYIKHVDILQKFLHHCTAFIENANDFMTEMTTLYQFWEANKDAVQLLPIHWKTDILPPQTYTHVEDYKSVFDALAIGVFLAGVDPHHTHGKLTVGYKSSWSLIDYTQYNFKWDKDDKERKIPYILNTITNEWTRINNLHVHSKDLKSCLSIPL